MKLLSGIKVMDHCPVWERAVIIPLICTLYQHYICINVSWLAQAASATLPKGLASARHFTPSIQSFIHPSIPLHPPPPSLSSPLDENTPACSILPLCKVYKFFWRLIMWRMLLHLHQWKVTAAVRDM